MTLIEEFAKIKKWIDLCYSHFGYVGTSSFDTVFNKYHPVPIYLNERYKAETSRLNNEETEYYNKCLSEYYTYVGFFMNALKEDLQEAETASEKLLHNKIEQDCIRLDRNPLTEIKPKKDNTTPLWENMIKAELKERLLEIEQKLPKEISDWKANRSLITCAAFCSLLFEKNYFVKPNTKRATPERFALAKYGATIKNQLTTAKKTGLDSNKKLLEKHFK